MAEVLRSSKDFWVLISGASILRSKELVGSELEDNSSRILNGILLYKPPSSTANEALQKEKLEEAQMKFILKLSKLLNVDEMQCYQLYCSYLMYEFKGTHEQLQKRLATERHMQALLYEVWNYYYSERLYTLLSMKQVLSHWQDTSHPYKELYEGFLESINKNNAVVNMTIQQLESVSSLEMPVFKAQGQDLEDSFIFRWVLYNLKEQLELLQILLLYYKDLEPHADDLFKLIGIFKHCSFGQKLPYRQYISNTLQPLVDHIGFLESLLLIECFEVDWLYACQQQNVETEHYLLKDGKEKEVLKSLDALIGTLGSQSCHGPVLLAWMLFGQLSLQLPSPQVYGMAALRANVFTYLAQALSSPRLESDHGIISTLIHTIVYSQLSILLSTFESGTLINHEDIFNDAEKVLSFENVANNFWEMGLNDGLGLLLSRSLEVFPWKLTPSLKLCRSLAQASPDSAFKVFELLSFLKTFAEPCDPLKEVITLQNQWQLLGSKQPYGTGTDGILIPNGTVGIPLKEAGQSSLPVVKWEVQTNGWQVCLGELDRLLHRASMGAGYVTEEVIERVDSIAQLTQHVLLAYAVQTPPVLMDIAHKLCLVLHRFSQLPVPPLRLLASCLSVQSVILRNNGHGRVQSIWQSLNENNFLPFLTHRGAPGDFTNYHCSSGRLGELVASQEKVSGQYDLLMSFLDFLLNAVESKPEDTDEGSLLSCIVYVLQDVFPSFPKWRYLQHGTREVLGQKCLNVFHKLLVVTESAQSLRVYQQFLLSSLLWQESGQTLLQVVATGQDAIQTAMETQGSQINGLGQRLMSLVRLSLSVLNRVLLMRHLVSTSSSLASGSTLEGSLFCRHQGKSSLLLGVAYYAFQRYDPALAALAVQLLRRVAKEFAMSLLGCLGSEAPAIRDLFLMRLRSNTEDLRLKVAIVQFLSTCVSKQPGLIECFISPKDEEQENGDEDNCLKCILAILEKKETASVYVMRGLRCACVEFLHSLWASHQSLAIHSLKQNANLWEILCRPIWIESKPWDVRLLAFVFHSLSLEVFHAKGQVGGPVLDIFKKFKDQKLLSAWSKYVCSRFYEDGEMDLEEDAELAQGLFQEELTKEALLLLLAWRDLLLIITKDKPIEIAKEEKCTILKDILKSLNSQISSVGIKQQVLILMSELYLLLFREWKSVEWLDWSESLCTLLESLASIQNEQIQLGQSLRLQMALLACATTGLQQMEPSARKSLASWVVPVCRLVVISAKNASCGMATANSEHLFQLCNLCICLLKDVLLLINPESLWLEHLSKLLVLPSLTALLVDCLRRNQGNKLAHTIVIFFLSLSTVPQVAEQLASVAVIPQITLLLSNQQEDKGLRTVYVACVQLVTCILQSQRHLFLPDVLNFIGVHRERMFLSLCEVRHSPQNKESLEEALQTCCLLYCMANYKKIWRLQHPQSYTSLLMGISETCNAAIAYLIRPALLDHLVEHSVLSGVTTDDLGLKQITSSSNSQRKHGIQGSLQNVQNRLMEVLAVSLATLCQFSPSLAEIFSNQGVDVFEWEPLLQGTFGSPATEQDTPLSFGAIIACINLSLKSQAKDEKMTSPSRTHQSLDGPLLPSILELSLSLLLSQLLLCQLQPGLSLRERQIIRRDIGAELNPLVWSLQRSLRKGCPSPASSVAPIPTTAIERPFLKSICQFVETFFK